MVRRLSVPIRGESIIRQLHENDLSMSDWKLIKGLAEKKINEIKVPHISPTIDLDAEPNKIEKIYNGNNKPHPWHFKQGIFKLDFRRLWVMTPEECRLDPKATVRHWLELVQPSRSPNANLLDYLVNPSNSSIIPKGFCEEEYQDRGTQKTRGIDIIFGGTSYLGKYSRKWVRCLYCSSSGKFDWGWVNLKESATARNYRLIAFSHEIA